MSFNGSGTFNINTAGQPVVSGTTIDATVFNNLTADLASGLSTAICKDGQTTVTANIPLGGYKITGLGIGTATTDAAAVQNVNARSMCEGRLTLTSGTAVTTSDVTAAETLYFTPYKGNCIALYDGTNWVRRTFSEISIDVPDVTGVHDVFAYDNAGTVTLEVLVWTNDTTRATALTLQDGVLVKTGALTRRYLGTFYSTTAGNGQTEDSVANRYLWNYYNRVKRPMRRLVQSSAVVYTTAAWAQVNDAAVPQLNFVIGVAEDHVTALTMIEFSNTNVGVKASVAIGLDSTTTVDAGNVYTASASNVANQPVSAQSQLAVYPGVGKHYLSMNYYSVATGTTTWEPTNATTGQAAGIHGDLWA